MLQAITRRLRREKRGISTVIVVMLSLVLLVIIVGNVVLWSYQMNQVDLERMQETVSIANATRASESLWYTARSEYGTNEGARLSGTYFDTRSAGGGFETFREETTLTNYTFSPSGYALAGSTTHVSGAVSDLSADNGVQMVFRSYPSATSATNLYAHQEQTAVGGAEHYSLETGPADAAGTTLSADAQNEGRLFMGSFVYPLTNVESIPASTWTIYYRAQKTTSFSGAHCDVDILIRTFAGAVRSTIATEGAASAELSTSWSTLSGTYSWTNYTVIDQSDYLEIDFYMQITAKKNNEYVQLRIDDNSLAVSDQTRIAGILLPSRYTVQVELTGSSNSQSWQSLAWTVNSAFTAAEVNTTLQLYDYFASLYPTSGDGYIAYTSSSTPNTEETKSQAILANPAYYRGSADAWKIRITGVKDTMVPFDLKLDWVEFKSSVAGIYRLNITNTYTIDLRSCPVDYIHGVELMLRYNVSNSGEKWFLKAYNWAASEFSDTGFNITGGSQPSLNQWNDYAISITSDWRDYIAGNGTVLLEFSDEGTVGSQTVMGIDYMGVRALIDGVRLDLENSSPSSARIIAVWISNTTDHQRYDADFFMNSGETATYIRADIPFPQDAFLAKVVTERGNVAVFSED